MAEKKKSFWTTIPGVVSGIAATITGLAVLIPLMLGLGSKHSNTNSASQNPTATTTTASGSPTPSGPGTTTTVTPTSTDSSSPSPGVASTDVSPSSGGATEITADPSSLSFGSMQQGRSADMTVTLTNPGSTPATIDKVAITGSNAAAFTITTNTCGEGSSVAPQTSCRVTVHFAPPTIASYSASLEVHYHPPQSAFISVPLSGSGALL
ncbi:MAG TPA: choice-of-anchor D domain-containing protein [Actinomycetota bacterium]|nr:choice-of-anchor D domain-containing protein [Actinomycetota bacterium]